ncbi:MAG: glycosyltransferase family 2 protein [Nanoarchaeota archaeon]|nr:glycosyltransferase family 2 protein [Nanoarchaeota archaeon]MBU1005775.1 glycosyltransferase family 2 protein [Nanoarchaeota archaeon]MBU1946646.1 glycosyltransferase family 2 protein [Nanoarchaeota archaeon]
MIKILISAYNESGNIAQAVRKFSEYGRVVVCDNESTDSTAAEASGAGAKVITSKKGKGNSVRELLKEESDIYVLADGDGAFYAEDCERMISLLKGGKADMVIGRRLNINTHTRGFNLLRKIILPLLIILFNMKHARDRRINDFLCGFRAFTNEVKEKLDLKSKGFGIETEITMQALKNNFNVVEIPIKVKPRRFGKQKANPINVGFPALMNILFS